MAQKAPSLNKFVLFDVSTRNGSIAALLSDVSVSRSGYKLALHLRRAGWDLIDLAGMYFGMAEGVNAIISRWSSETVTVKLKRLWYCFSSRNCNGRGSGGGVD